MNQPTITEKIGGYDIQWNEGLLAKVSRIHVHQEGNVTGELQIHLNSPDDTRILLPASSFNFSSDQTRAKFSKQLSTKWQEQYPELSEAWTEVFDVLAHEVQQRARSGEKVQDVWLEDDVSPPDILLDPVIYQGVQNIIFGEKGTHKSTLSYLFGVSLFLGWEDNPLELAVTSKSIKSLVLDYETDEKVFRYCLSRLKRGMDIPAASLAYRRCYLPLADDVEAIGNYANQIGAEILIVDSLGAAAGGERGELKGSEAALRFNSALRQLKRTSLIIAQTSKDTETKKKSIYGSTFFSYYGRNIFELCQSAEEGEDILHLALFHRECNLGKKHFPMGFRVTYDDSNRSIAIAREPVSVAEFAEKVSVSTRILSVLKEGSMTPSEISSDLQEKQNTVNQSLKRLKARQKVTKVGEKWGLLYDRPLVQ